MAFRLSALPRQPWNLVYQHGYKTRQQQAGGSLSKIAVATLLTTAQGRVGLEPTTVRTRPPLLGHHWWLLRLLYHLSYPPQTLAGNKPASRAYVIQVGHPA